jgi:hypothetical protein
LGISFKEAGVDFTTHRKTAPIPKQKTQARTSTKKTTRRLAVAAAVSSIYYTSSVTVAPLLFVDDEVEGLLIGVVVVADWVVGVT